jgi:hypothetical protein
MGVHSTSQAGQRSAVAFVNMIMNLKTPWIWETTLQQLQTFQQTSATRISCKAKIFGNCLFRTVIEKVRQAWTEKQAVNEKKH